MFPFGFGQQTAVPQYGPMFVAPASVAPSVSHPLFAPRGMTTPSVVTPATSSSNLPTSSTVAAAPSTPASTRSTEPVIPAPTVRDVRKPNKDVPGYRGFIQIVAGQGDEQKAFDVHEYLITARSLFFKKALSGDWKEAQDRVVKLPKDDPDTVHNYVHFLYTGSIAVVPSPLPLEYRGKEEVLALAKLYVLAEKIQDIDAKNAVIEAVLLSSRQLCSHGNTTYAPGPDSLRIVYAGTGEGSPMRRLLVDIYTYRASSKWLDEELPSDFYRELALDLLDKRAIPADPTRTGDASSYLEVKTEL